MQDDAFVVVFPTEFARIRMGQLLANVKKILKVRGQDFEFAKRDGNVIIIRANDPVFASYAANRLFGIEKIAIARRTEPTLDSIVSEVARLGGNLLLKGEKFLVRVEGQARGFIPKDAEVAATSAIIESKPDGKIIPGSENRYDKILYTYITKKSAYVCIFLDRGHGGIPNHSQQQGVLCPVYDEISAIACIESMKQGYETKIIVPFRKKNELGKIAKLLNKVIQYAARSEVTLEFYGIGPATNQFDFQSCIMHLCHRVAQKNDITKIAVPITSQMFPVQFVDSIAGFLSGAGMLSYFPLEGKEDDIRAMAREYVLEKFLEKIKIQRGKEFQDIAAARFQNIASDAMKTKRVISIKHGPNNLHDILDSLE